MRSVLSLILVTGLAGLNAAERINHAGRILGPVPVVTTPVLFNTSQADGIVAALQIMPRDNPWNEDVSALTVLANSVAMTTTIRDELAADRRGLRIFYEMNYVLVPDAQGKQDMRLVDYPDESDDLKAGTDDIGRYPFPDILPVEGWPRETGSQTNSQWQASDVDGDRHSITVQPSTGAYWETWQTRRISATPPWQASNLARWNLGSNTLRPAGWTSADAAGLPMFPALIRYDEVQRGEIEHALRLIVKHTRAAYLYPATHHASVPSTTNANTPAMGQRLRLKDSFVIPAGWSAESKTVAKALKRYGALVADNGGFFSISACPDDRFPDECFDDLRDLTPMDFDVVQGTGPTGGPRSAGAPTVNAGTDKAGTVADGVALTATASGTGLTTTWALAPHVTAPGTVGFTPANALATQVTFSASGTYTLLVRVSDGIHTPAYDAVLVTVTSGTPQPPALDQGSIRLHGTVDGDTVSVLVNGTPAPVAGGVFTVTVADDVGDVTITATDGSGNSSSRTLTVSATPAAGG